MSQSRNDADIAFIKALAELLNANDLAELNVKREYGEKDSLNVRVAKMGAAVVMQPMQVPSAAPSMAPAGAAPAPSVSAPIDDPARHPGAVASPMVGTAYLSAEPGSPPFVAVGAQVAAGDTLMIIEAMKTMNHIPAPHAGTVKRILVADGCPVEYGAPLMIIE